MECYLGDKSKKSMTHTTFRLGFVWGALAMALLVGFAIGAHLTAVLGLGFGPGRAFASFVQVHGHIQLVGWAGLFIMGISLHVLPRFAGAPITRSQPITWTLWLMISGLLLRTVGQTVLPYLNEGGWFKLTQTAVVASGGLELVGIGLYITLIAQAMRVARATARGPVMAVAPFVGSMLLGWTGYAVLNASLLIEMVRDQQVIVEPSWNHLAIQVFVGLVLLPIAFVFSVRFLPLYLRLEVPVWSVRKAAYAYLLGWAIETVPVVPPLAQAAPKLAFVGAQLGMGLKGGVVLWIIWQLGVLSTWRRQGLGRKGRAARPAKPNRELFGRFDWLIVSAYLWLGLGAFYEIIIGMTTLVGIATGISPDAVRHLYLLGFVSLLIFGMGARLLPGLLNTRRIASPGLVGATFWLGNAAVLSRVLLVGMPPQVWQIVPGVVIGVRVAFAFSGMLGMMAVGCLWINLRRTANRATSAAV